MEDSASTVCAQVADGAAPIRIPIEKGLAGATYTSKRLISIPDAYEDSHPPSHPAFTPLSGTRASG